MYMSSEGEAKVKMTEDMRNTMITVNDNTVWIDIDMTIH